MRKYARWFFRCLILATFFSSCSKILYDRPDHPGYIANVSNINTTESEPEFNNTTLPSPTHIENQTTFAILKNHAFQYNSYFSFKRYFAFNEGAWSYKFKTQATNFSCISAGYGYGALNYKRTREYYTSASSFADLYQKRYDLKSFMHRVYIQPAMTWQKGELKTSLSARLSGIYFPVYTYYLFETKTLAGSGPQITLRSDSIQLRGKYSMTLDPAITIKKEDEDIGTLFQIQFSIPLTATDAKNKHHLINSYWPLLSVGFYWKIGKKNSGQHS